MNKKWEYKIVRIRREGIGDLFVVPDDLIKRLQLAGSDGWDAVGITADSYSMFVLLKREIST